MNDGVKFLICLGIVSELIELFSENGRLVVYGLWDEKFAVIICSSGF